MNTHREIWDKQASLFDTFSSQSYSWKYIEEPTLNAGVAPLLGAGTQVLDVGCGTGRVLQWLIQQGVVPANLTGIDISPNMLRGIRAQTKGATLLCADISRPLPQHQSSYSLVTAVHVFQHFDALELSRTFRNIWDMLLPEGHLCFIVEHPLRQISKLGAHGQPAHDTRIKAQTPWGNHVPHFFRASSTDYLLPLLRAGFTVTSVKSVSPVNQGIIDPDLFREHSTPPSRLYIDAVRPHYD